VSYKYVSVAIDTYHQRVWLTGWEAWNATTHVGTSQTYDSYGGYRQDYTFNLCDFVLFIHPRYIGMHSYVRSIAGPTPCFVVETQRENPADTAAAGYPCWGFLSPSMLTTPAPFGNTTASETTQFAMPRIRDGSVGKVGAKRTSISIAAGRVVSHAQLVLAGGTTFSGTNLNYPKGGLSGLMPLSNANAWDGSQTLIYTPRVWSGLNTLQGRMYGFKATKISGAGLMNTVSVPLDAAGFYSAGGTAADHYVIPMWMETTVASATLTSVTGTPLFGTDGVINGNYAYFGTSANGVVKIDLNNLSWTSIATASGIKCGLVTDGRYVWFCDPTNTRVGVIDTTTDTVTYGAAISGSTMYRMCHDGTNLWAIDNSPTSTSITVRKLDAAALTQVSTLTTTLATTTRGADIASDLQGNIAFLTVDGTTNANGKLFRIAGGAITGNSAGLQTGGVAYNVANVQWTGVKGIFDVVYGVAGATTATTGTTYYFAMDASATTPVTLYNGVATSAVSSSLTTAGYVPNYMFMARYGRGWLNYSGAAASIVAIDMESAAAVDLTIYSATAPGHGGAAVCGPFGLMVSAAGTIVSWQSRPADANGAAHLLIPK
jgi:hypothetical protein